MTEESSLSSRTFRWHGRFGLPAANRIARDYYLTDLFVPRSRTESLLTPLVRRFEFAGDLFLGRSESPRRSVSGWDEVAEVIQKHLGLERPQDAARVDYLLLTDYSHSDRGQLVAFVFNQNSPKPVAIAKVRTSSEGRCALRCEFQTLQGLWSDLVLRPTLPEPLALHETESETVLLESAVRGRSLYFHLRNDRPGRETINSHFERAFDWLLLFQSRSVKKNISMDDVGELYLVPAANVLTKEPEFTGLFEDLERRIHGRREAIIPVVPIQGDFWARNILLGDDGDVSVIDWENYKGEGLPLDDALTLAVSYGDSFQWRFGRWEQRAESFGRMFIDEHALRPLVARQLKTFCESAGIDSTLLPILIQLFLVSRAAEAAGNRNQSEEVGQWLTLARMYAAAAPDGSSG